jgi:hypothetical protein
MSIPQNKFIYKLNNTKIKNYLFEILEFITGGFAYLGFYLGFSWIWQIAGSNIDYSQLPLTTFYFTLLSLFDLDNTFNSSRLDIAFFLL